MAQKVEVHFEDDLDGGPADTTIALDGRDYEIDLSHTNAEKLREALRPLVAAGRKTTRGGTRDTRGAGARASGSDPDTAKIRAWAKANGHPVSDRGRIQQSVKDAYYGAFTAECG
jgi:hypothetical protein